MKKTKHGFKTPEVAETFLSLSPILISIVAQMIAWCEKKNLPFVITSAIREFESGQVSMTHPEGRAVDVSVHGWSGLDVASFVKEWSNSELNRKYGALKTDGTANLVVYHKVPGGAFHFHIQVRPSV